MRWAQEGLRSQWQRSASVTPKSVFDFRRKHLHARERPPRGGLLLLDTSIPLIIMKGNICIRGATFLSFAALILLIFMHVGQINVSKVPRELSMARVNVSAYGIGLESATGDPTPGLYNSNASSSLAQQNGLRQVYAWGLYSYCGYVDDTHGSCSNTTFANAFTPFNAMLADTPSNYTVVTKFLISKPNTTFTNTPFLQAASRAAYYLILVGTICTFLATVTGIPKSTLTFTFASLLALLGTILLLVGAALWTALIRDIEAINHLNVDSGAPLGIEVTFGTGLWLLWAAFAILAASLLPYFVSCYTYRPRYR